MRIVPFSISLIATAGLLVALGMKIGPAPRIGPFLSPQTGFWQNAEPPDADYDQELQLPGLRDSANIYFDERLVPHVFATNDHDVYYIQGYLHAKFRLWQMEFQTFAAAGMLSQVIGPGEKGEYLKYDRSMRRLGMIYAAERSLEIMNADPVIKTQQDAYTAGVNAWIDQLTEAQLPLEYKLLDYKPQRWTNLKSALFIKYMAYDLAGHDDDLEFTNAKNVFTMSDFEKLYPVVQDSLKAIVPVTVGNYPAVAAMPLTRPASADSLYFDYKKDSLTNVLPKPDKSNGSNDWAVAGLKTADSIPILCNDPHLGLNLPSIWYEMQLSTPDFNAYGVTFPGVANVVIGYNDSIAFGVTNAGRDVKDYYEIRFRDSTLNEYWYDSAWVKTSKRVELIGVRGQQAVADTVAYTVFGPVIYDQHFPVATGNRNCYAVRWKAHDPSNELRMFYDLDHAKNQADYAAAIRWLSTPGQNPVFAGVSGDIAIWQQGDFPAKWRRQGDFFMPGTDSSYAWKGIIPQQENPHMLNPARGYVSSANQLSVDTAYPYYTGNDFPLYRGYIINRYLDTMNGITVADMQRMQTDNYNIKAEEARPILLATDVSRLNADERRMFEVFAGWNLRNDPDEQGATVFQVWWDELEKSVWGDEIGQSGLPLPWPNEATLIESLRKDSAYKFLDDISTRPVETLPDLLIGSLKKATILLLKEERDGRLAWWSHKSTRVDHLLKIPAFSRRNIRTGGGAGIINATKENHGPSWRMIVKMSAVPEAYAVYPGGQSGNPGSHHYDDFIDTWSEGKYYRLWMMKPTESADPRVKLRIHLLVPHNS